MLKQLNCCRNSIRFMRELILCDEDEALRDRLRQTERLVACIDGALRMLTDEEQYILDRMFVHRGDDPVDDICAKLCMEKSNLYRIRKRALDKFTLSIFGRL